MTQRRHSSRLARLIANTIEDDAGHWIWQGRVNNGGYPVFAERVPGRAHPVKVFAHRAMLEEWYGYLFPHDEAGHRCYIPRCIRPDCLEVQTKAHNLAERRSYGTTPGKSWIPVLYPTPARELAEAVDAFLDEVLAWE